MLAGSGILLAHFVVTMPEPAPSCGSCHQPQAEAWHESQHRTAFTEATFQTAHAIEPLGFCVDCHAPEADPRTGVGCSSCHLDEVNKVSCDACHQFEFPDAAARDTRELMQSTVDEHAASRFSGWSCVDCHRPHTFAASRDPEMLRSALDISAERLDGETIVVTLRAAKVGHAVPTGDLLRRLEVGAAGEEAARMFLSRHFGPRRQSTGLVVRGEVADNRVPADGTPRRVKLRVGPAPVRWWVKYQRVAHQRSFDERDAELDGEVLLAEGAGL